VGEEKKMFSAPNIPPAVWVVFVVFSPTKGGEEKLHKCLPQVERKGGCKTDEKKKI